MENVQNMTAKDLYQTLNQDDVVLIDVREPSEYGERRIQKALNVPLSSLDPAALEKFSGKMLVFHCAAGSRSLQAIKALAQSDHCARICQLEGGIQAWCDAGYETVGAGKALRLPLMRQVQFTIGLFILVGVGLTYFVHAGFLILPAIMGAGLVNAGLSGWCGLAKLMAVMPWNR